MKLTEPLISALSNFPAGAGLSEKMQVVLETLPVAEKKGRHIVISFPPL